MRKIFLIIVLLFSISTVFAQQQSFFPYKNNISLSLDELLFNSFMTRYEHGFRNNHGIVISAGYYSKGSEYNYGNILYRTDGYLGEMQYKNYFTTIQAKNNDKIWNRFYIAPYVFYRYYEIREIIGDPFSNNNNSTLMYKINSYGAGLFIGYKLTIKKFSFETYIGGGIKFSNHNLDYSFEEKYTKHLWSVANNGIIPKVGINIGFSF